MAKSKGNKQSKSASPASQSAKAAAKQDEDIDAALGLTQPVARPSSSGYETATRRLGAVAVALLACIIPLVWVQWPHLSKHGLSSFTSYVSPSKPVASTEKPKPRLTAAAIRALAKAQPCKDRHGTRACSEMAARGECDQAPGWMYVMCAASCQRCDMLDPAVRCDPNVTGAVTTNAYGPGDLERMFLNLPNKYDKSKFEYVLNGSADANGKLGKTPWMAVLHDFVTDEEIETLKRHTMPKLARSTDQGEFDESGYQSQVVSKSRTSSNAWCMFECEEDPIVEALTKRISELVGVDTRNFESYQVLEYKKGQRYDVHHDANEEDRDTPSGPRILTFFMYFSDVEEGGETHFPELGVKVKPRKGSALLWPSVLDRDPASVDHRTLHAALPVIKGKKYAANTWIHLRDYKNPNKWGCTGSFS